MAYGIGGSFGGPEAMMVLSGDRSSDVQKKSADPVEPRSYFPETWLWEEAVAGYDGRLFIGRVL